MNIFWPSVDAIARSHVPPPERDPPPSPPDRLACGRQTAWPVADEGAAAGPVADEEGAGALWLEADNEDAAGPEADEEDASAAWPVAVVRNVDGTIQIA
jgi:hypothetical protein